MYDNVFPRCHRCGQNPPQGLYDGFRIRNIFFCRNCEEELLILDIGSLEYQQYANLIRGVLTTRGERIHRVQ